MNNIFRANIKLEYREKVVTIFKLLLLSKILFLLKIIFL